MCRMWFCFIPLQMTSIPHTNPVDPAFLRTLIKLPLGSRDAGRRTFTFVDRLRNTYSYSLIDQLMSKLTIANPQQEEPTRKLITYESMGIDVAMLSDLIARDYFGNYKIVSALAQEYGFKYFFFLPPMISLGNKPLTPEEQEMKYKEESEAALHKLFTAVYQTIERESSKYQNLYSMIHIFDRYDSLMWIDEAMSRQSGTK